MKINFWLLEKITPYARNARKIPPAAVDKVAASIREFGWRQPIVVDREGVILCGHARLLAAHQLGLREAPVHVADNLTPAQARAYRLLDNRSHDETTWDDDLLGLELLDLKGMGVDLDLTGFDGREIDALLAGSELDDSANGVPDLPANPVTLSGDLWLCGPQHRILCADATRPEAVSRLLGACQPLLLITDPPYGISLDSEWRDRAGLNGCGAAQASYMKHRSEGHTNTSISSDTRADWSEAFALVPSLQIAYVWHASVFHPRGAGWAAAHRLSVSAADYLEQGPDGIDQDALLVPA